MALCGDFQNKFLEKMVSIDTAHPGVFAKSRAGLHVLARAQFSMNTCKFML